jgi:hypothetical protein
MKGKILLVVGLGVGYVLGAKAGRERYESIKRITDKFWNSKGVQAQVHTAEDFVKDKAKQVVSQVTGSGESASKKPARTSGTRKPATARPAARKSSTTGSTTAEK